jgi:hypothetical protein
MKELNKDYSEEWYWLSSEAERPILEGKWTDEWFDLPNEFQIVGTVPSPTEAESCGVCLEQLIKYITTNRRIQAYEECARKWTEET